MILKKILLVHNYYQQWGGEDSVFEKECELLRQRGHQVDTLVFHNREISSLVSKVKAFLSLFYSMGSAKLLRQKIRSFKPDVIHVHNFFPMGSPSLFSVARKYNVPIVMTLHNFRLVCANALLFRENSPCEDCLTKVFPLAGIKRACYRNSSFQTLALTSMTALHKLKGTWKNQVNRYIMLNHFARDKVLHSSLSLKPEQVVVKPNFVFDPYGSSPPEIREFRGQDKQDFVLFVGRLSIEKGIRTLLAAYRQASPGELPPLKIIGSGPLEAEVLQLIDTQDNVEYLGFQERDAVLDVMKKSKALLLPSSCYENFPMTIVEALATGTPVITSNTGGLPGIIKDGYNGFLVTVGDPVELRQKIRQIAKVDYAGLCHNARKAYVENYSPGHNYSRLIEIYNEAAS